MKTIVRAVAVGALLAAGFASSGAQEAEIPAGRPAPLLSDQFDGPSRGWTLSGLWRIDGTPAAMPGGAAFSGSRSLNYNDGHNYATGAANSGSALSPLMDINTVAGFRVRFRCNYGTETTGTAYDRRSLRILRSGRVPQEYPLSGTGSPAIGRCAAMGLWHEHSVDLAETVTPPGPVIMIARSLRLEFTFDSVDSQANAHPGWFVDDVRVHLPGAGPAADDHGDTAGSATVFDFNSHPMGGRIERAGDVDLFTWSLPIPMIPPGGAYPQRRIEARTLDLSAGMDTVLSLYEESPTGLRHLVTNDDASASGKASFLAWTLPMSGQTLHLKVRHHDAAGTGAYKVDVVMSSAVSDDHGDSRTQATALEVQGPAVAGRIEAAGDVDYFTFAQIVPMIAVFPPPAATYVIETSDLSATMDTVITLYDAQGQFLKTSDDAPGLGLASRITYTGSAGQLFYVKVRHYGSSETGRYKIKVTRS